MTRLEFTHAEGVYILRVIEREITFQLTNAMRAKGELHGTLTIFVPSLIAQTTEGVLKVGRINLMAPRTVSEWITSLTKRIGLEDDPMLPWADWFDALTVRVDQALKSGPPLTYSADRPLPAPVAFTKLPGGLVVLDKLPMLICGDGEVGKSTLGVWIAGQLAQQGHVVLWLDWEEGEDDFLDKLHRLYPAEMPGIYYHDARAHGPIWDQRESLRHRVRLCNIDYVIVDSVAMAIAGSEGPQDSSAVTRYFGEIAALGPLGSLHLAHVAKTVREDEGKSRKKPTAFGSVFWQNLVRLSYFADSDDEGLSSTRTVALYRTKMNRLAKAAVPHLALDFTYDDTVINGAITVKASALVDNEILNKRLSYAQRICAALGRGTMTTSQITVALYDTDGEDERKRTRAHLSKLERQGRVVNISAGEVGRGHEARWALLSGRKEPH